MNRPFPPELQDGAFRLRQWTAGDFDFYGAYLGTEATARFYGGVVDRQKAWRHLASVIGHWSLRGFGVYAVEDLAHGGLKGCAGLWEPCDWPCREFVYWFTPDAYEGGCALAAARLAFEQASTSFPGELLTSFIHPDNGRAIALAASLGGRAQGKAPLFDLGPHLMVSFSPTLER